MPQTEKGMASNVMRQERHASTQKKVQCIRYTRVSSLHSSRLLPRKERFIKRAELLMKNGERSIFVEKGQRASWLIYQENVAVIKEYNIPCHYEAKYHSTHTKNVGCGLRNLRL